MRGNQKEDREPALWSLGANAKGERLYTGPWKWELLACLRLEWKREGGEEGVRGGACVQRLLKAPVFTLGGFGG